MKRMRLILVAGITMAAFCSSAHAETAEVTAQVRIIGADKQNPVHLKPSSVVIWLSPVSGMQAPASSPGHFRLIQKNKTFQPHLLVVPLGSTVDFPNMDPFFHNVFSQFNGKRFDLGLYEEGSSKTVRFDHEGVSYIFCNIHPEMSAIVIALGTPYAGISSQQGNVEMHNVIPDIYDMHVWAEGVDPKQLNALTRRVRIGPSRTDLGVLELKQSGSPAAHKNKYGQDYFPEPANTY